MGKWWGYVTGTDHGNEVVRRGNYSEFPNGLIQEHCQNRKEARDINAAKNILAEGLRQIIMS